MAVFDPNEHKNSGSKDGTIAIIMVVVVIIILLTVFLVNKYKGSKKHSTDNHLPTVSESTGSDDSFYPENLSGDKRTSDELDIWDIHFDRKKKNTTENAEIKDVTPVTQHSNEILITYSDGSTGYVAISNRIKKNKYDVSSFVYQKPFMKYYDSGVKTSFNGVMISERDKNVNFTELKEAGVDFVMVCAGYRDRITGEIVADANFDRNVRNSFEKDMYVGVYFNGYADDIVSAREEAEFLLGKVGDREITYPVTYCLEPFEDTAEAKDTTGITVRTDNVLEALSILEDEGYLTMVGGDKETLVTKLDLTMFADRKIWLIEPDDIPNYPYEFAIWSYSKGESIPGTEGRYRLLIGLEDLNLRQAVKE